MSQFKTKEFLRIQKHWYEILAKHGFVDSELVERALSNPFRRHKHEEAHENQRIYYQLLSQHLSDAKRMPKTEKLIMQRLSDGATREEISREIKAMGLDRWHPRSLRFIIRKWEHRWGIRIWTPEQLDPNWKTRKK